jgi:hypothetical protein
MTSEAASRDPGRRGTVGLAVALLLFLIAAPSLLVLGPLLLLLLLSRPATAREWLWIALAVVAGASLANPLRGGLPQLVTGAGAVFLSGAFAVLCHGFRELGTFTRAAIAVLVSLAALAVWGAATGLDLASLESEVLRQARLSFDLLFTNAAPDQRRAAELMGPVFARLFAGITVLQALAGAALAWAWYHRVAGRPVGRPPGPFRVFRFNDHLVWGAIFTLGAVLVPFADPVAWVVDNALVVWTGLYAARGVAILISVAARWTPFARLAALAFAVLAFPFAAAGVLTVGLADTWLDFRGRLASARGGSA